MNYNDILIQAMDIISKRNVELTNYDTTILCTVIESKGNNEYEVSNGSAKFTAYATVGEYKQNEAVYVNIPMGDYNQQKFIIGKKVDAIVSNTNTINPFDNFLDISGNLISTNRMGLTANGKEKSKFSEFTDISEAQHQKFTKLGLSCVFKTNLTALKAVRGNYGIKIYLITTLNDSKESKKYIDGIIRETELKKLCQSQYEEQFPYDCELQALSSSETVKKSLSYPEFYLSVGTYLDASFNVVESEEDAYWRITMAPKTPEDFYSQYQEILNIEGITKKNEEEDLYYLDAQLITGEEWKQLESLQSIIHHLVPYTFEFAVKDMFGNPYNFNIESTQKVIFDLPEEINSVEAIRYEFFQDGDFYSSDDKLIESSYIDSFTENVTEYLNNLFISDVYIALGYDASSFGNNAAVLFTMDGMSYRSGETAQIKEIKLRWIQNTKPSVIEEEMLKQQDDVFYLNDKIVNIYWYQYKLGHPIVHPWAGVYWKELEDYRNKFSCKITPDYQSDSTQIKVVIKYGDETINSERLVFENENPSLAILAGQFEYTNALSFEYNDNYNGVYYIYNKSGELYDSKYADVLRTITCYFQPTSDSERNILIDADYILWDLPYKHSMIEPQVLSTDTVSYYTRYGIQVTPDETTNWDSNVYRQVIKRTQGSGNINAKQGFNIRRVFNPSYSNNTIKCIIEKNGVKYECQHELLFGSSGTNGTNVTFSAKFADEKYKALTIGETNSIPITFSLVDRDGKEYLTEDATEDYKIHLEWLTCYSNTAAGMVDYTTLLKADAFIKKEGDTDDSSVKYNTRTVYINLQRTIPLTFKNIKSRMELYTSITHFNYCEYFLCSNEENNTDEGVIPITKTLRFYDKSKVIDINESNDDRIYYFNENDEAVLYKDNKGNIYNINNELQENIDLSSYWIITSIEKNEDSKEDASWNDFCKDYGFEKTLKASFDGDTGIIYGNNSIFLIQDNNGNEYQNNFFYIELEDLKNTAHWLSFDNSGMVMVDNSQLVSITKNDKPYTINVQSSSLNTFSEEYIFILQATLIKGWSHELTTFLPIPIRDTNKLIQLDGPTVISYNSEGTPTFDSSTSYSLQTYDANEELVGCKVIYNNILDKNFLPTISGSAPNFRLNPKAMMPEGAFLCAVQAASATGVWQEPILMTLNRYASAMIDEWDGSLKIDEVNNVILAARIAAGSKDTLNQFSGVMMGDWSGTDGDKSITKQTGLYGFHKGELSFGFKQDGTAFIGKASGGRLLFDGNESTITSNLYKNSNNAGMKLDFDDGLIEIRSSSGNITLDANPSADDNIPFKIGDNFSVGWTGNIKANSGFIGGWEITSESLKSKNQKIQLNSATNTILLGDNNFTIGDSQSGNTDGRLEIKGDALYIKENNNIHMATESDINKDEQGEKSAIGVYNEQYDKEGKVLASRAFISSKATSSGGSNSVSTYALGKNKDSTGTYGVYITAASGQNVVIEANSFANIVFKAGAVYKTLQSILTDIANSGSDNSSGGGSSPSTCPSYNPDGDCSEYNPCPTYGCEPDTSNAAYVCTSGFTCDNDNI